jgi:flagellar protein FliJ
MPRRFRFALQPLLEWRTQTEHEKQREFAARRRDLDECASELERLIDMRRHGMNQLAASARASPAVELRLRDAHLRGLVVAIEAARIRHAQLAAECERAREELIAASRERRVVERLRERRHRAFGAEEARRDELELDEANARSHERRLRERRASHQAESAAP